MIPLHSTPRPELPFRTIRPTYATVDLAAIAHNLAWLRAVSAPRQVYAVLKADAYGHGMVPVAERLERSGVDGICVALVEEGLTLRRANIRVPIVVLNGVYGEAHQEVLASGLTPVLYDAAQARAFQQAAGGQPVRVHLKVDTGMGRLGVPVAELDALLGVLDRLKQIRIDGVMTHLSSADTDGSGGVTRLQIERFEAAIQLIRQSGHRPRFIHAANSAGICSASAEGHTLVRAGLALYGVPPMPGVGAELRPALSVRSRVISLRDLPAGSPVGYSETFRTTKPSRIATVAIGYGDGLLRSASNRGIMLVGGRRCPIVGRVSMDLTTLDVTDVPGCVVGDEVVVLGSQGAERITAEEQGRLCGTIPYEVLTSLSARVPRHYV